jgi:hypothetical protein
MTVAKSIALFVLAAIAEIGGAWLIWPGWREHRGLWWIAGGIVALGAYGFVATFQPDPNFGRILASYGGIGEEARSMSDTTEANKAIVQRLVDEVLNGGNLDLIEDLYRPALASAARRWIAPFRASFPDVHMDTVELIAEGGTVIGLSLVIVGGLKHRVFNLPVKLVLGPSRSVCSWSATSPNSTGTRC